MHDPEIHNTCLHYWLYINYHEPILILIIHCILQTEKSLSRIYPKILDSFFCKTSVIILYCNDF